MEVPTIFQHTTLEAYLGRYFQYRKSLNPSFSYAVWAKKLQVKSPATLCMITKGQRSPGKDLTEKLKRELALNNDEARYFETLVGLKKHRTHVAPSLQLMKELESQHPDRGFKLVEHDEFRMISKWYCWALLEMVTLKGFKEDSSWIARMLEYSVSETEVREALATLERLKLVGRDRNGKMVRTSRSLITRSDNSDEAIREYHKDSLKNAMESLFRHGSTEREFQAVTLSLTTKQLPEAKKMIRKFVEEFCRTFDNPNGTKVHQLELALFPLTENLRESKK